MSDNVQLTHANHQPSQRYFPLSILVNDINSPLNVGSLFRLSDALGIEKLYLCGETPAPPHTKINKTSRSTEKYVNYESHRNAETLVENLRASGVFIIALEISSSSIALHSDEFKNLLEDVSSTGATICLILGAEKTGISDALLDLADVTTHIPMLGNNSSMNVVTAAGIACYEISRRLKLTTI